MSERMRTGRRTLSASVIVAGLIVAAGLLAATLGGLGATKTVTETRTAGPPSSLTLHTVTFNETGSGCTAGYVYESRWYVTLANITIVQPSNATLPIPSPAPGYSAKFAMISKIVFTVPDGTYPYYVSLGPRNGTVTVSGSDVVVQVPGPYCT